MAIPFTDVQPSPVFHNMHVFYMPFIHFSFVEVVYAAHIELIETRHETDRSVELTCEFESDMNVAVGYYRKETSTQSFARTIAIGGNKSDCQMTPLPDNISCQCITNRNVSCTIFGVTAANEGEEWKCAIPCNGVGLFSNVARISSSGKAYHRTGAAWPLSEGSSVDQTQRNAENIVLQKTGFYDNIPDDVRTSRRYIYIPLLAAMLFFILTVFLIVFKNVLNCEPDAGHSIQKRTHFIIVSMCRSWRRAQGKSKHGSCDCKESMLMCDAHTRTPVVETVINKCNDDRICLNIVEHDNASNK